MLENEGVALRAICWSEIFPWLSIAKGFRLAVTLKLMTFGAVAVLLTVLGWWEIARIFSRQEVADVDGEQVTRLIPNDSWSAAFPGESAWQVIDHSVPSRPFAGMRWEAPGAENAASKPAGLKIGLFGPMFRVWAVLSHPVWRILSIDASPSDGSLPVRDFLSLLLSAVWSLAIWAYFGAAISRVAAVQLATGEQVGWAAALRWARAKWAAYFSAPAMPMLAVAVVVLPIFVLGLLMRLDLLAFAAALIWPLVLVGGFVMTVLLAGVLLGWPLMWATVSVEGTDSFDALNRTYAYVFQRPLRYLFYVIVAGAIGWLGWIVVETLAASVIWLASWAASWGAGAARIQELTVGAAGQSSLAHAATGIIAFWSGWVKLLALGYAFSYFAVASTAIYYLLRRDVDARETDEVFLDADASEAKFGLPKLGLDASGAPEVVETAAAGPQSSDGKAVGDSTPGLAAM